MGQPFLGSFGALAAPVPPDAWRMPLASVGLPRRAFYPRFPVTNQTPLGACTGFGIRRALSVLTGGAFVASAMALYRMFRIASGFPATADSGAYPEPCARALVKYGAGSEARHPWNPSRFAEKPSYEYELEALDHLLEAYYRALSVEALKTAIAYRLGAAVCFDVPPGFDNFGVDGLWVDRGGRAIAGHCQGVEGYDDDLEGGAFVLQQSWGTRWGRPHPDDPPGSEEGYLVMRYQDFPGPRVRDCLVFSKLNLEAGR